uniref:Ubiquitin carboxyl-terminal hydrolase 36 n=1 Tax=Drosophila mojavensis TaxID=7230 RepID=UBP36_DROMO|nr:RecName: Full=Ubiquitin carboxyl-terminal hydrolase 36; AltName: Full=Deubiquitinating enzyme 36; AltName: Full=Protein scrawny; AltName: Full=Ubiquitin thioesterase 36; AltName: Full=Ubiquitin-specific-processing protease 36 [Drosophila mojavensis]
MPVSLAVCETANVVNAALRESLGGGGGSGCVAAAAASGRSGSGSSSTAAAAASADEAKIGDPSATDNLQSQIVANAKRVLLAKIEYEEVENYHESVLAKLKSKYIVIKPDNSGAANCSYKTNGASTGKALSSNGHDNTNGVNGSSAATVNGNRKQTVEQSNQNSTTNPNELPKPKRVLYPRENIRIGWKQSDRKWQVGAGMLNVGNTCYLNSTLQALFHIPALANWLVSETAHVENCNISESCGSGGCIICAMAKTLQTTQSNQTAVRPFLIYTKLRQICKHMVVGRQEDAHEFLRFLVEAMEKAYLMRFRNYKELDQLVKETTPLSQIFGGYLRSEVRCLSCNHVSITFQHFQDLLLDIRKADTLEEAFDGYFSRERLEDMGYKCEGCKKKVSATKQFSLERAPITLCIQLKRFSMMGNKLTKQISFKPRIDLSRFAARSPAASTQPLSYRLVSMVTHLGVSQHCGHYTAIGLTESGSYYNFDDSYVRPIAMQSVCNTNAYIMFYELDVASSSINSSSSCSTSVPKLNGLRLNGQHSPSVATTAVAATATSTSASAVSPRFIGPQLPNGYANNNGHVLGAAKTSIQFKSSPQKQPQQQQHNGLLMGANKFQESAQSKHSLVGSLHKGETAANASANAISNANSNKSSCNNNTLTTNSQHQQQHILPISSDEEDEDEDSDDDVDVKANTAPQLPSMPKMFEDAESVAQTAKLKPKTPLKSLVPYESASEEEQEQQQQQQQLLVSPQLQPANPRKRRSGADSSESEDEPPSIMRNGHAKSNGSGNESSTSTSIKSNNNKQKTDAIDEIFKSLNNYKNKHRATAAGTTTADADEDEQQQQQVTKKPSNSSSSLISKNGWQSQNGKAPASPKTPPSPAVIKSKTGIWQITRTDDDNDDDDEDADEEDDADADAEQEEYDDEVVVVETTPSITTKNLNNPFASKPSSADAMPGAKRQKLLNGSAKSAQTPRVGNGYQSEATANGNAVSELLKQTHRGYGTSVLSWTGKTSDLDKQSFDLVCAKRIAGYGDMDGSVGVSSDSNINNSKNIDSNSNIKSLTAPTLLAEAREQRKRDAEDDEENEMDRGRQRKVKSASVKSNNGIPGYNPFQEFESQKRWNGNKSGSFPRFYQNYRQNFQQRNKFKYNRFGGGGAKFQQQRALQRHLAAGGGFTRRQHQSTGHQQQQQQQQS